jgi:hypothetical protein
MKREKLPSKKPYLNGGKIRVSKYYLTLQSAYDANLYDWVKYIERKVLYP